MKRRVRKTVFELPPLELECMKALWAQGEASVAQIRAHINGGNGRALAYTTIETIMDRLTRKGAVSRRKVGRAHVYSAQYESAAARADAVEVLVHHFFGGSRRSLAAYLAGQPTAEPPARPVARPAVRGPSVPPSKPVERLAAAVRRPAATSKASQRLDTSLL
jgi:predicted transcriptional regulator